MSIYEASVQIRVRVIAGDPIEAASIALQRLSGPESEQVPRVDLGEVRVTLLASPVVAVSKPPAWTGHSRPHMGTSDLGCICIGDCCNDSEGNCTCSECPNTEHRYHRAA